MQEVPRKTTQVLFVAVDEAIGVEEGRVEEGNSRDPAQMKRPDFAKMDSRDRKANTGRENFPAVYRV